jgi:hypothetical protein
VSRNAQKSGCRGRIPVAPLQRFHDGFPFQLIQRVSFRRKVYNPAALATDMSNKNFKENQPRYPGVASDYNRHESTRSLNPAQITKTERKTLSNRQLYREVILNLSECNSGAGEYYGVLDDAGGSRSGADLCQGWRWQEAPHVPDSNGSWNTFRPGGNGMQGKMKVMNVECLSQA